MKRLFITAFVLSSFATYAQMTDHREDLQFGGKAGINISNVYDGKGQDFVADSKAGLAVGAFISVPINKFIGFQPEIIFSQKGFTGRGKSIGLDYKFIRTTSHIDVPLLLQIKPTRFLTIVGGPEYSYLTSIVDEFKTDFGSSEEKKEFTNNNIQKNLFGIMLGADVHLGNYFLISGRVAWDVINNRGDGTSESPRYKNQWAQLTAGFSF